MILEQNEDKKLVEKLRAAKSAYQTKFAPTQDEKDRSRALLASYIVAHGGKPAKTLGFLERLSLNLQYFVPPKLAYSLGILTIMGLSWAFAGFARSALPGQSLYGAKIALEKTHVRFVSNPATRAKVQMEFAGNRLKEARAVAETASDTNQNVEVALNRFTKEVQEATRALKAASDPVQVKATATVFSEKVQEYKQELQQISGQRAAKRTVELAAVKEAEEVLSLAEQEVAEEKQIEQESAAAPALEDEAVKDDELKEGEVGL